MTPYAIAYSAEPGITLVEHAMLQAVQYQQQPVEDDAMYASACRVAYQNAQWVYGERLAKLFGTSVEISAIGEGGVLTCLIDASANFHCYVDFTFTGCIDGKARFCIHPDHITRNEESDGF